MSKDRNDVETVPVAQTVALAPGKPARYQVSGLLSVPTGDQARVVQVLVSGATYGRDYWDPPVHPEGYTYVRAMAARGIATLNLDRLGIGLSSHPPAELVTVPVGRTSFTKSARRCGRGPSAGCSSM